MKYHSDYDPYEPTSWSVMRITGILGVILTLVAYTVLYKMSKERRRRIKARSNDDDSSTSSDYSATSPVVHPVLPVKEIDDLERGKCTRSSAFRVDNEDSHEGSPRLKDERQDIPVVIPTKDKITVGYQRSDSFELRRSGGTEAMLFEDESPLFREEMLRQFYFCNEISPQSKDERQDIPVVTPTNDKITVGGHRSESELRRNGGTEAMLFEDESPSFREELLRQFYFY